MTHICIPLSTSLFLELAAFLKSEGSDRDPADAVDAAIRYWMENATWKQADLMPEIAARGDGFRWKEVYLPADTRLRMRYKGQYHYATVEGDQVVYQSQPTTPSDFANKVTGTARNAWRDLEIRRPGDDEWIPAQQLRAVNSPSLKDLGL